VKSLKAGLPGSLELLGAFLAGEKNKLNFRKDFSSIGLTSA
jgi:hypothetical protein